jgi:ABC-type phosphate transport system substrate-binding protein
MSFLSKRRALSAGIAVAASVAAFVAPSAANAALPGHCKGSSTEGAGSSLQAEAQAVWDPGFSANKSAGCVAGPTIAYHSIGSGAGYKEWNEKEHFGTIGFVGTDNTVNLAEKESVEKKVDAGKTSKLLTIPVLQGAVAIVVNLPENCTASSKAAAGRLGLNQSTLEGIYAGTVTTWKQIGEVEGPANVLTGTGCNAAITPVVRLDSSGTTHIFKKFLNLSDNSPLASEDGKEHTWAELAEGSLSTKWPTAAKVLKAETETGPGVLKTVAAHPGSVGYANLADARNTANGGFTGQSASRFWVELESSKKEKTTSKGIKITRKYVDPSKDKDTAPASESNCKSTEFTNGPNGEGGTFPPPSADAAWNEVTAAAESKTYALCGLTYDLVLTNYSAYASHGGNENEAQTVKDFETYVLSKKGGAKEIKAHDYAAVPASVVKKAEEGVAEIIG